ncbi:MAG: hypothetical protein Q4B85_08260 [Lachnospiraceae bacterium]|nr:hypothetical protein [Lachnospiraceae bacterium]
MSGRTSWFRGKATKNKKKEKIDARGPGNSQKQATKSKKKEKIAAREPGNSQRRATKNKKKEKIDARGTQIEKRTGWKAIMRRQHENSGNRKY